MWQKPLEKHAPMKLSKTPFRDSQPWYNQEPQSLKRSVQNRERMWHRYKQGHQWLAHREYYNKYTKNLNITRMIYTQNEVTKFKGNSKIADLTGSKVENPLPEGLSDEELAEHFANFFIEKIENIRDKFNSYTFYGPIEKNTIGKLSEFKPLSTDEIRKLIVKMQSKSCELDCLPTHIMKHHIDSFIPILTKIVNLSLDRGVFSEDWKTAILRPLLKKKWFGPN